MSIATARSLPQTRRTDGLEPMGGIAGNELGVKTNWIAALAPYFGTAEIPPNVRDNLDYTDPGVTEFFPSPNPQTTMWFQKNLRTNYSDENYWQARHSPIVETNNLRHARFMVAVEPSTFDRAGTQSVASYLSIHTEQHITELQQYIKGYEIDGALLAHKEEGPALWAVYQAGIIDAKITTMLACVEAAIIRAPWYWQSRRELIGVSNPAPSVIDALREDFENFGGFSKRPLYIYSAMSAARKLAAIDGVTYDTTVLPEDTADRLAANEVNHAGELVGPEKVNSLLIGGGAAMMRQFAGHKVMAYRNYYFEGQSAQSLSESVTDTGRFWVASPCKYAGEIESYDSVRAPTVFFMNIEQQRWDYYEPEAVDDSSIYFERDNGDGVVSRDVAEFAKNLPKYLGARGITLDPNDATQAVMPHIVLDPATKTHRPVTQHGQQNPRFCSIGYSRRHGQIAVAMAVKKQVINEADRRVIDAVDVMLDDFYNVDADRLLTREVQGWFAAVAMKNEPTTTVRARVLKTERFGGASLPDVAEVGGVSYLGVETPAGFRFLSGDIGNFTLVVDAAAGGAKPVAVPDVPYGFSTPPAAFALAEYYAANSAKLGGYEKWRPYFQTVAPLRNILMRLHKFFLPVYPFNPSMDPANVPVYFAGAENQDAETRSFITFVASNMFRDRTPLMVAVRGDKDGKIEAISTDRTGAVAQTLIPPAIDAKFLTLFGVDGTTLSDAAVAKDRLKLLVTRGYLHGPLLNDLTNVFADPANDTRSAQIASVWAKFTNSMAQREYKRSLNAGGAIGANEVAALASTTQIVMRFARLDTDLATNKQAATAGGNFLSNFYKNLKNQNAELMPASVALFNSYATSNLSDAAASHDDVNSITYLATPLAIGAASFSSVNAKNIESLVVRPNDTTSRNFAVIGGGRSEADAQKLREFARSGTSASALKRRYGERPHLRGLSLRDSSSSQQQIKAFAQSRVNDEPNTWSLLRFEDNQNESDPFVRAAANLFDESPFTLGQRRRFREHNFLGTTNFVFVQYDGRFRMQPVYHFRAGAGRLLTMMENALLDIDKQHFKFSTRFSTWFECDAGLPRDTLIVPNQVFKGYVNGYGKRGIIARQDIARMSNAAMPFVEKDTYVYEVGTEENEDTLPEFFTATGVFLQRDVMGAFNGTNDSTVRQPWLLFHDYLFQFSGRNSRVPESFANYDGFRLMQRRNLVAARCAYRSWIPRSVTFKSNMPAVDALGSKVRPGQLHIYNGGEGILEEDTDLLSYR